MGILKSLAKLDPTKIISDEIKQRIEERRHFRQMVKDMKPEIDQAYNNAFISKKIEIAQEKARRDALPWNERMKLNAEERDQRMKEQNDRIKQLSELFAPAKQESVN